MSHDKINDEGLIDCHGSTKALRLLQTLQKTPAGKVLYQQIERILRDTEYTQNKIIRGYAALVLTMIEAYRRKLPKDSLLYLELKLIQKRLIPPISISELASLQNYLKSAAKLINELSTVNDDIISDALGPLLGKNNPDENLGHLFEDTHDISEEDNLSDVSGHSKKFRAQKKELGSLNAQIHENIGNTKAQHEKFSITLEKLLAKLDRATSAGEVDAIKKYLAGEIKGLQSQQRSLNSAFSETTQLLSKISSFSNQLDQELNQVRVLSLTDDLTNLPNRRAFIRRLEDEISRSQREESPLILGLLDLDYFKEINDRFGHSVGDVILQIYASDILSVFRHYDMIARYGGEEFAVILPNTDYEGAVQAMNKVRNKAAGSFYQHENTKIALPSFSAGLAKHQPGESSTDFIERVDSLLYRAKQGGRNRVEFDEQLLRKADNNEETIN